MEMNQIYNIDCLEGLRKIPDGIIDLTVTSPPYDDLRTYDGCFTFDFERVANELLRVTKEGGVVVWIVNDATIKGGESGTSFKQALYFKEIGFRLSDTMIWEKPTFTATGALRYRYAQVFEYMFILVKGAKPKTFNPIMDRPNKSFGDVKHGTVRQADGATKDISSKGKAIKEFGQRFNVWRISPDKTNRGDGHPAIFPEQLVRDHILSWSNPDDLILDPFMGSGTTAKAALSLGRKYIGFEISEKYCKMANERIELVKEETK